MMELGFNLFQFIFTSTEDMLKVLHGKIWTFENQYLILREWKEEMLTKGDSFQMVDLWIQIWNLPHHWVCSKAGLKIGKMFTAVNDVLMLETGSVKGRHIKILASIDLDKPLIRG